MNKLLAVLVLLSLQIVGLCQNSESEFETSIGEISKYRKAYSTHYACPKDNFLFIVKLSSKDKVYLTQYNTESMQEVSVEKYKDFPKHCTAIDLINLDDELYYIYAAYNRGASNYDIFSRHINAQTGVFDEPKLLVTTSRVTKKIRNQLNYATYKARGIGIMIASSGEKFHIFNSADKSKTGIVYMLAPENVQSEENHSAYGVFVFDSSFEKLWGGEISMPYFENEKYEDAMLLTNKGEFKILTRDKESTDLELLTVNTDKEISSSAIEVTIEKKVSRFAAGEDDSGHLIFVGLFAKTHSVRGQWNKIEKETVTSGVVQFSVDQEGSLTSVRETNFTDSIVSMNLSPEYKQYVYEIAKGEEIGLLNFVPLQYRVNPDGTSILMGESQRAVAEVSALLGTYYTSPGVNFMTYYFGNIVYVKLKRSGEIDFVKKVPKNQKSVGYPKDLGTSHFQTSEGNYFGYMDNILNHRKYSDADAPISYISGEGGWLTLAYIDAESGDLKRMPLTPVSKLPGDLEPRDFKIRNFFGISEDLFMAEVRVAKKKVVMLKFERRK